jgi:hypothetical protein
MRILCREVKIEKINGLSKECLGRQSIIWAIKRILASERVLLNADSGPAIRANRQSLPKSSAAITDLIGVAVMATEYAVQ